LGHCSRHHRIRPVRCSPPHPTCIPSGSLLTPPIEVTSTSSLVTGGYVYLTAITRHYITKSCFRNCKGPSPSRADSLPTGLFPSILYELEALPAPIEVTIQALKAKPSSQILPNHLPVALGPKESIADIQRSVLTPLYSLASLTLYSPTSMLQSVLHPLMSSSQTVCTSSTYRHHHHRRHR